MGERLMKTQNRKNKNKNKNVDDMILVRNLFHLLINFAFVFKQPRAVAKMGGNRMLTDSGNLIGSGSLRASTLPSKGQKAAKLEPLM